MRPSWSQLERRQPERAWAHARQRFLAQVVGPHFEHLCREFAYDAGEAALGGVPGTVAAGTVADPARRSQIQLDVVVFAPEAPGEPRKLLSIGEVKWGEPMTGRHLARLRRARDLLAAKGFDVRGTVLACYGAGGFDDELRASAAMPDVVLFDVADLY